MGQDYFLDDKYTNGIWYDQSTEDFCKIQRANENAVELVDPDTGNPYTEMNTETWVEYRQQAFQKVSENAIENPTQVISKAIRVLLRNDPNELMAISDQKSVDIKYAYRHIELTEI